MDGKFGTRGNSDKSAGASLIISLPEDVGSLISALTVCKGVDVHPTHIESRPSTKEGKTSGRDYFLDCKCTREQLDRLVEGLQSTSLSVSVFSQHSGSGCPDPSSPVSEDVPWFPRSVCELYRCCTNIHKDGTDFTADHPGFADPVYKKRRKYIASLAYSYKYGEPIPTVDYWEEEVHTWGQVFRNQTSLYPTHACKEYNDQCPALFQACGYREDNIPQLEDVSKYLRKKTGWQVWPVVGWIQSRDFLAALAFRTFPTSQYIRHKDSVFYTPEPDICHELLGHIPLFCDPNFAQFSQELGLASLGVPDEWIDKLSTLYWFTIEFGLVREDGKPKAYGAGLLSGYNELKRCVTNEPEYRDLDISEAMMQPYTDNNFQPLYFVASSLDSMKERMVQFAKSIPRPLTLHYNPNTQSVEVINKPVQTY